MGIIMDGCRFTKSLWLAYAFKCFSFLQDFEFDSDFLTASSQEHKIQFVSFSKNGTEQHC